MNDSRPEWLEWVEKFSLRCLLVSLVILVVWAGAVLLADDWIISLHAKFLGVDESNLDRLASDATLIHYQFLGIFKLGAACLFFIPWLVLRFSRWK